MFQPVSAFIGMRYARASKGNHFIAFINLFSVIGIALGLMALITVLSVMNGFEGQLKQRVLGINPHIMVDTRGASEAQIQGLQHLPGVLASSPMIEAEGVIQASQGLNGVLIQGVEPQAMQQHSVIAENMLVGSMLDLQPGSYRLIIGRALSMQLNLNVGDQVRMIAAGASVYSPFGNIPSQRIFTISGVYSVGSELDDKVVLMSHTDAARLMRTKPQDISETRLFLQDAFAYQPVVDAITALGLDSHNWRARQGPLFDAVKMEKNMMALMLLLIVAVAAFNIVSALVMVVTEKQGDIAILRTQGMTAGNVMQVFLYNGLYNGIKGTLFGVVGGLLLVNQLNNLLKVLGIPLMFGPNGMGLPVDLRWQQVGILVVFSLLLCFIATLYPALRAMKVNPASALKYE